MDDFNLMEFVEQFNNLKDQSEFKAVRFGLCGQIDIDSNPVHVDALDNRLHRNMPCPLARRDYDSLMGFSDEIGIDSDSTYYPYPPPKFTLTKKLHIFHPFIVGEVSNSFRSQSNIF